MSYEQNHHQFIYTLIIIQMKTIKAEILMIEGAPFPAIEKVYDPSSKNVMGGLHHKPPLSSLDITWIC